MFHPLYNHLRHKWELQNQNDRPYFPEYPDKHHGLSVHAVYPKIILSHRVLSTKDITNKSFRNEYAPCPLQFLRIPFQYFDAESTEIASIYISVVYVFQLMTILEYI